MREVGEQLLAWRAAGERVAVATVVRLEGSAPRPVGATLLAASGARIAGSVSNGCVEADLYEQCLATLTTDRARLVRYGISDELAFTVGLSCGGSIDVLVEPVGRPHERVAAALSAGEPALLARVIEPAERAGTLGVWIGERPDDGWDPDLARAARAALGEGDSRIVTTRLPDGTDASVFLEALPVPASLVIVGATDIAMALARFAKGLGYRVVVADPRTALATRERFPEADDLVHLWPDEALARVALEESAAVVVLSHDAKFDHPALVSALRSRAGYVGAIGSRRTNEQRFAWLREQGFAEDDLARVHAPIGLDLGARTAEEVALAIAAELVAARRGRSGGSLRTPPLAAARSR